MIHSHQKLVFNMKLEALYNAVIVKPVEAEETSYGGIIVPDLGNEKNKPLKTLHLKGLRLSWLNRWSSMAVMPP